jgi:type IV pilus assembly protein PilB
MRELKRANNKQLGELLIERGVISHPQLDEALEYKKQHGGLIGEVLVSLKFATEHDIAQALTCQYGFPYLPLASYEIDEEILRSVPEKVCRQCMLIPIDKIGKSLTVAMSNPLNIKAVEDVELITGCIVQVFVTTTSDVKETLDRYYNKKA